MGRTPLSPDLIAQRGFTIGRRGFDQAEVRAFLAQVSEEVQTLRGRIEELDRLRNDAEDRAAHPVLDEDVLMEAVGEETAAILRSARAAAGDMRQRAQEDARRIVHDAEEASAARQQEAEAELAASAEEAKQQEERALTQARQDADEVVAKARDEAQQIKAAAERERRITVEAAQSVREKILADLSRRRRVASVQIEQLRAGRQRLLESYALVRRTLEEVHSDLQRADAEARVAADDAGRKAEQDMPQPSLSGATEPVSDDADAIGVLPWRPTEEAHAAATLPEPEPEPAEEAPGQPTEALEPVRSDVDEALLQRRDAAILDIEATLTRKLKRALQDDQNDLLDRLRNLRGAPTVDRLLPDEPAHRQRLAETARSLLDEAAAAGSAFAAEQCKGQGVDTNASERPEVADLVNELSEGITGPLRRRLAEALGITAGEDQAALTDAVGAAYREWKSQRIERAASDVIASAFSRGSWSTVPDGTRVRWVPEDVDGPCPDCDDDSLAGAITKGEAFPTGQLYPPAHSGCRCLLVPVGG